MLDIGEDIVRSSEVLRQIETALLERQEKFVEIKFIENTAFPVIKITCSSEFLNKNMDITILDQSHSGMKCVDLVKEYIHEYEGILKPLVFILKHLLYKAGLNDPY